MKFARRVGFRSAAVMCAAFALVTLTTSFAGTKEAFVTGSGNAYAQIYRVGPTAGRLSLAPVIGLSLADYVNTVGRGETKAADWAGIGVSEPALPDNTPTLRVASTDKDAAKGKTVVVAGQKDAGTGGGAIELFARATNAPLGESHVRLSSISVPDLIEVFDSEARTVVGVVKGNVRRSVSTVEIGRLDLAGTVQLLGLRWESVQETREIGKPKLEGQFTIEGVRIAGMPLPLLDGSDLESVLGPINAALAPTGFALKLPVKEERGGQSSVSPLAFEIVDSSLGRQYLAPIVEAIRPVREPVVDAFIDLAKSLVEANEEIPDATVGVLAADLTVGIASGSSQLHIELGGVNAFTEGAVFENPFGLGEFKPPSLPDTVFTPGAAGTPGTSGTPAEEGELVAALPSGPDNKTVPGGRGGIAIAVGLAGLAVAAALAVADYRRMRASRLAAG